MVAHVVLFTPKPSISAAEREAFVQALEAALHGIPLVRRATVGRRFLAARPYDALTTTHYEYLAVLEFESRTDLLTYLDHPAHDALAAQFYGQMQVAAAYDFDVVDGRDVRRIVG